MSDLPQGQERIVELTQECDLPAGDYPVWSPYEAHEAAAILLELLRREEGSA